MGPDQQETKIKTAVDISIEKGERSYNITQSHPSRHIYVAYAALREKILLRNSRHASMRKTRVETLGLIDGHDDFMEDYVKFLKIVTCFVLRYKRLVFSFL